MRNSFLALLAIIIVFSCKKELLHSEEEIKHVETTKSFRGVVLNYEDFIEYGELHNAYLTNIKDNFISPSDETTLEGAVDFVSNFNVNFANSLNIANDEKIIYENNLIQSKNYVVTHDFMNEHLGLNGSFYQKVDYLFSLGGIDLFEKESLIEIGHKAYGNYNGNLSTTDLKLYLEGLKSDWESKEYLISDYYGSVLPIVLSISLHSLDWWANNSDAYGGGNHRALPAWAAADVGGAIVGVAVSTGVAIVNDDIQGGGTLGSTSDRVKNMAVSAVKGAAVASSGAVKKVGDFIRSFF